MNAQHLDDDQFEEPIDDEELFNRTLNRYHSKPMDINASLTLTSLQLEGKIAQYKSNSPPKKQAGHNSTKSETADIIKLHSNGSVKTTLTLSPHCIPKAEPILKRKLVMSRDYLSVELERKSYSEFKYTFRCTELVSPKCDVCIARMNPNNGAVALGCKNGSINIYIVKDDKDGILVI